MHKIKKNWPGFFLRAGYYTLNRYPLFQQETKLSLPPYQENWHFASPFAYSIGIQDLEMIKQNASESILPPHLHLQSMVLLIISKSNLSLVLMRLQEALDLFGDRGSLTTIYTETNTSMHLAAESHPLCIFLKNMGN